MSYKTCKYCGDQYDYSVTSNGYSEKYCTITCEHASRIDSMKKEIERLKLVEEKFTSTKTQQRHAAAGAKATFPTCYAECELVKIFGVGECELSCPEKFRETSA